MENVIGYSPKASLQNSKIWFIDNENGFRNELIQELTEIGMSKNWRVLEYSDDVSKKAKRKEIDVLVCDYKMPNKDGISLLEDIRRSNKEIFLVLYTGYTISIAGENADRCHEANILIQKKLNGTDTLLSNISLGLKSTKILKSERQEKGYFGYFGHAKIKRLVKGINFFRGVTYEQTIEKSDRVFIPEIKKQENETGNSSYKSQNNENIDKILLELAGDYIKDLEMAKDPNAFIFHSIEGKITVEQLKEHVLKLTPIGVKHLKAWFKAERIIRNKRNNIK